MKFLSYWHDTAPAFAGAAQGPVEGHFDVAVIGGGFTGLVLPGSSPRLARRSSCSRRRRSAGAPPAAMAGTQQWTCA